MKIIKNLNKIKYIKNTCTKKLIDKYKHYYTKYAKKKYNCQICKNIYNAKKYLYYFCNNALSNNYIRNSLNIFTFGYLIYDVIYFYDNKKYIPTAGIIVEHNNMLNYYNILVLINFNKIKGRGKILINKIINKAKINNIKYIVLECSNELVNYYKKFNFELKKVINNNLNYMELIL